MFAHPTATLKPSAIPSATDRPLTQRQPTAILTVSKHPRRTLTIKTAPDITAQIVPVELGPRSYPIYIGADILTHLGTAFTTHCPSTRAVIITDDNVAPLYAHAAQTSLNNANIENQLVTVAPGESSKCIAVVESLYDKLLDFNAERRDTIIALGGGVVGDLAGFAAATFKRGLPYVQVPTSLLAMVDSSIGGKTGINHPRGKNMIGAFHQPQFVLADIATLNTLPPRELGCGLAETVKHGVLRDADFFVHLEENIPKILNLDRNFMSDLVVTNCRIKADVVASDERESGLRGILNLGHTLGHALETVFVNHDFHHGEAVALGLVAAARLAAQKKLLDPKIPDQISELLAAFGLPTSVNSPLPAQQLYQAMRHDKKNIAGKIKFVLPTALGACTFADDLTEPEIINVINSLTQPRATA